MKIHLHYSCSVEQIALLDEIGLVYEDGYIPDNVESFEDYVIVPVDLQPDGECYSKRFYFGEYQMWGRIDKEPNFLFIDFNKNLYVTEHLCNSPSGEMIALQYNEGCRRGVLGALMRRQGDEPKEKQQTLHKGEGNLRQRLRRALIINKYLEL